MVILRSQRTYRRDQYLGRGQGHSKNMLGQWQCGHCLMTHFFHCLKYANKERKRVKIGKIRKHVRFESPNTNEFLKLILCGLIFAKRQKNSRNREILSTPKLIYVRYKQFEINFRCFRYSTDCINL